MLEVALGIAGTAVVSGVGALVCLLWNLNTLVAKQNGTLASVVANLDDHRKEDRADFDKVHDRIDTVVALLP